MSIYTIQDTTLTDIADAIRSKTGKTASMTPAEMVDEIESISGGGDITDSIVVTARDSNGRITEVDFYGTVINDMEFGHGGSATNDYIFRYLETVNIKNAITAIGNSAFQGCATLQSFSIPPTVTTIGKNAFDMCGVTSIDVPESVTLFQDLVFGRSSLKNVILRGAETVWAQGGSGNGTFYQGTALETVQLGSIGHACTSIKNVTFNKCTQSGLTITIYTTGSYVDTAVANTRNGATNATIIIKASEVTTYGGTSYAAGDTIVTSTP